MKRIYEAANSIEAHMIVHMLEQSGIQAFIQGEHLQSGAGDLPLGSLVAVAVADEDASAALRLIREWEARTATPIDSTQQRAANRAFFGPLMALVVGAAIGGGVVWSMHHGAETSDGIDWNDDGELDERAYFDKGRLERVEYDRNFDRRVDFIERYDLAGLLKRIEADEDFDGRMETRIEYRNRDPAAMSVDEDGDGKVDVRTRYRFGVATADEYLNSAGDVVKEVTYRGAKPVEARLDLDADGTWERSYRFDRYDEPVDERRR